MTLADGVQNFNGNETSPAPNLGLGLGDWSEMGTTAQFSVSDGDTVVINTTVGVVPEPATALLLGLGLSGLAAYRGRR